MIIKLVIFNKDGDFTSFEPFQAPDDLESIQLKGFLTYLVNNNKLKVDGDFILVSPETQDDETTSNFVQQPFLITL